MNQIKITLVFALFLITIPYLKSQSNFKSDYFEEIIAQNDTFRYKLNSPSKVFVLPAILKEISGITLYNETYLACIQDEKATIYLFSLETGKVIDKLDYKKDGDFEDIEIIGETAYLLRSDGKIFEIIQFENKNYILNKYKTSLRKKNNTEGLTYDYATNSLLISCKDESSVSNEISNDFKTIYMFTLKDKKLIPEPSIVIHPDSVLSNLGYSPFASIPPEIEKKLNHSTGKLNYKPSGIAIHPISKRIYIISSVGKLLIVADFLGNIIFVEHLNKSIFKKPEGICFESNGTMYISNEGKKGKGNILKFKYQK